MPTTLTLKNIPDKVYKRLKIAAEAHRRSLNMEAIVCLEQAFTPRRIVSVEERIARVNALRESLGDFKTTAKEIDAFKKEGRA